VITLALILGYLIGGGITYGVTREMSANPPDSLGCAFAWPIVALVMLLYFLLVKIFPVILTHPIKLGKLIGVRINAGPTPAPKVIKDHKLGHE